jgi:hypothetical protein
MFHSLKRKSRRRDCEAIDDEAGRVMHQARALDDRHEHPQALSNWLGGRYIG